MINCENPACNAGLSPDCVMLITTKHVRRFCNIDCLMESHHIHLARRLDAASPIEWPVS